MTTQTNTSRSHRPGWGTLAALAGIAASPFASQIIGTLASLMKRRDLPVPSYYSNFYEGPFPQGSVNVAPMDRTTNGLVYDPARDKFVSPEEFGQVWGWRGGPGPTAGDY